MLLPAMTKFVLMIGRNPIPIVIPFVLALVGLFVAWAIMQRTSQGRRMWAWLLYGVPLIGTLVRAARLAAFADLLAVLVEYELPLPEAFQLEIGRASCRERGWSEERGGE